MGVSVVSPVSEFVRFTCERSPRVVLITDSDSRDKIPESIRGVADDAQYEDLSCVTGSEIPANFDGAVIWCTGEQPIAGAPADWRRPFFSSPNRNTWIAVQWPYLEQADLLGLEPRLLQKEPRRTIWNPSLRIAGANPSETRKTAWRANGAPWARLSLAIWQELEKPGSGMDSLLELWNPNSTEGRFSALVLRNLIVVLMKCNKWEKAGELLDLGKKAFPGCAEFPYLHAVYFILQESPSKAVRHLESALNEQGREFVGSGGENSFRARYLLGVICEKVGRQEKAIHYWINGILQQPAFEPSVRSLCQQRFPRGYARGLHFPLAELVRREPLYLEPVVTFMTANDMTVEARSLVETMEIDTAESERMLEIVAQAEYRQTARPRAFDAKPGIELAGPLFDASGHSRINRVIGQALIESPQFEAALSPTTWPTLSRETLTHGETLWEGAATQIERVDLTIRHQWPPDFKRPSSGKLVCILPWEHKAVPVRWIEEIEAKTDEVWSPSEFTRSALVNGGVSPERVHVVPYAIDPEIFRPDGPAYRPPHSKGFIFLFVGGTIRRKGIDLLLQAYADAFMPEDDVTLVIKDLGCRSFYAHITKLGDVLQFAARRSSPHTIVLTDELEDAAVAALYRGADAFVLPYRGEGFGMPLIEAMACGKPIVTTGAGPAVEFCSEQEGYLIPAREVEVPEPAPPIGPLSADWTWLEPSVAALAQTMRHIYEHRDDAAARGRKAAAAIATGLTWNRVLPMYLERIQRLVTDTVPVPRSL